MSDSKHCPVCEYPEAPPVWEISDRIFRTTEEKFVHYRCPSCRMIFLDEGEVRERLAEFYPSGYWWKEQGMTGKLERNYREWMVRHDQLAFVQQVLGPDFGGRLLDVGSGSGTFVKLATEAGLNAYGLEMSKEAVELASNEVPGRFKCGTEQDLVESGEEYEVLTLFHTLEHVPQPFKYLKGLHKLLKRPGRLILQVPNSESLQARWLGSRWYGLDCPRHLYNYSTFSVLHLLGRAGYRIDRLEHFSLRDNACCLVSSLLPSLDPMASRVRSLARGKQRTGVLNTTSNLLYMGLMLMAQPLARAEAALGRGASIFVAASIQ